MKEPARRRFATPTPGQSGGKRTSATPQDPAPALDLGVKLGECSRGRGQALRYRWRTVDRDDGTQRAYLEIRLWSRSFDGWYPSRIFVRIRPEELAVLGDAVANAQELAEDFEQNGGAA